MNGTHTTQSVEETISSARTFSRNLRRGDVVALYGELGSGKTQFVKGVCKAFNVHTEAASPSFVILNRYEGKDETGQELLLYHIDLYRVKSIVEIYELGYEEYLLGDGICLIEWADMLGTLLPTRRYDIHLSLGSQEYERQIDIVKIGDRNS